MTTDAPSTARLLELAKNCDDLSEFYASAKHPDTVEPARRYADIAAAGALWGGFVVLYGASQGQTPSWAVFGKHAAIWPYEVYQLIRGQS